MLTRFICLANSFKEGGRCIAGVELDENSNPVFFNGRPKWIRPVWNSANGEIPTSIGHHFKVLDIIELEVVEKLEQDYQSENVRFRLATFAKAGTLTADILSRICEARDTIFGNKGKAISQEMIDKLNYSLILIETNKFEISTINPEDKPDKPKTRLKFNYANHEYDLPVTDPVFLTQHQQNPGLLLGLEKINLCISISVEWNNWYYKLIAGVFY